MHLSINTSYYFAEERRINKGLLPVIHITITAASIMAMFHFPFFVGGARLDLRLIPIILLAYFHGWKYTVPVVIAASLYRLGIGGPTAVHGAIFGIILPSLLPMAANLRDHQNYKVLKLFAIITAGWGISHFLSPQIRGTIPTGIAISHLASLLFAFAVMYFFVITGRNHLEMTQQLQFYAERDPLTGLYNMRKFEEKLDGFTIGDNHTYLAMIDIDRFKTVNDRFGHQAGDAAIQAVGKVLLNYCGEDVLVARYGGDEFILFMAAGHESDVKLTLDSIREDAKRLEISPGGGLPPFTVSLSIGFAQMKKGSRLKDAIEEADKQLYSAKKLGRDRVC